MKVYINTDKNGAVTGYFRHEQYPGQKTMDESDKAITDYSAAKLARVTPAIEDRLAKLESDLAEVKEAEIAK